MNLGIITLVYDSTPQYIYMVVFVLLLTFDLMGIFNIYSVDCRGLCDEGLKERQR